MWKRNTNKEKRNTCYRRKFTLVSLAGKKKVTLEQNILVTATLVK